MSTLTEETLRNAIAKMDRISKEAPLRAFQGMPTIVSTHLPWAREQFRFPRSKRKRIRKKWAKQAKNFRPSSKVVIINGVMYCNPMVAERLKAALAEGK